MNRYREKLWYLLNSAPLIGPVSTARLLEYAGDIEELTELSPDDIRRSGILDDRMLASWMSTMARRQELFDEYDECEGRGIHFLSMEHEDYPQRLRNIPQPPYGISYIGRNPSAYEGCAAVIGARGCTDYGREIAYRIAQELGKQGICVVSGMAAGIDTASHWGCLDAGCASIAVLGGGVDDCYPAGNRRLYDKLCREGTVISEQPMGMPPLPNNFRQRNRLISGLADCVIVAEARKKSGTQITVTYALDQGRDVFCVPGRITDVLSSGCNDMIAQGAQIVCSVETILDYFGVGRENDKAPVLTQKEQKVAECLDCGPLHIDALCAVSGMMIDELMELLTIMEIRKIVVRQPGGYYRMAARI